SATYRIRLTLLSLALGWSMRVLAQGQPKRLCVTRGEHACWKCGRDAARAEPHFAAQNSALESRDRADGGPPPAAQCWQKVGTGGRKTESCGMEKGWYQTFYAGINSSANSIPSFTKDIFTGISVAWDTRPTRFIQRRSAKRAA